MKYEFEKLLRQRKLLIIVTIALIAVYIFLAFSGSYDTFTGFSVDYFWEDEEYREFQMSQETELVDEAWIENMHAEYKAFVDENMMSPEEIAEHISAKKAEGFQIDCTAEEAIANCYDIDYAFEILKSDAYYSRQVDTYVDVFNIYIPLAEDAVQYIHDSYERSNYFWEKDTGKTGWEYMGYSDSQWPDYWNLIDTTYEDLELTVGYSLGWDVLCSVMQFLPFTLGMALIVVLGNLFSQEQTDNMLPILRTTKNGRSRLLRRKLRVTVIVASALWLLFQFAMLIAVSLTYTLRGSNVTAMCFSGAPNLYGLSWLQYYLINCVYSYLGTLVFALFVCCMSSLLKLRLSMPINLVLTLLTGIPLNNFRYADQAFKLLDKLRAITPAQLMASYSTLQVYQSYEFGNAIVQLPYMMAFSIIVEAILLTLLLHHREGGR